MKIHTGSDRARRTAIRLLRWYPRPWRRRYEREMHALLEDMPVRWRQVANIAATAVREWLSPRAFGWPARSAAGRIQNIRRLTFLTLALAMDAVARAIAWGLKAAGVEVTDNMQIAAAIVMLIFAIRVCGAGFVRLGKQLWARRVRERYTTLLSLSDKEIAVWAALLMPQLIVFHAEAIPSYLSPTMVAPRPYVHLTQLFVWSHIALESSTRFQRLARLQAEYMKQPWTHWRSERFLR